MNDVTYQDAFVQGVSLLQRCEKCELCAEHQHVSAGERAFRETLEERDVIDKAIALHAEGPVCTGPDDGYSTDEALEAAHDALLKSVDTLLATRAKTEETTK